MLIDLHVTVNLGYHRVVTSWEKSGNPCPILEILTGRAVVDTLSLTIAIEYRVPVGLPYFSTINMPTFDPDVDSDAAFHKH